MSPKGLKHLFHAIRRRLFRRGHCEEVEYGQTLSKKRRKNCVLKSVASLPERAADADAWVDAPYRIKFEFSSDDREFRGSVLNFQKIDPTDVCCLRKCCERCFCTVRSAGSVSSDSACEVASGGSSCADCSHGRTSRSVEDFIRIHSENFLADWEPDYETLPKSECDYDILMSKSNCNVLEPSYENLKLVENFYETPKNLAVRGDACAGECAARRAKDLVHHGSSTYDEVIESLKVLHSSSDLVDNDINDYLESFKTYENDANDDVESVSFNY